MRRAPAARAVRALERGATTLGIQVARSIQDRWRRAPAAWQPPPEGSPPANATVERSHVPHDVSEIEVRDLRADLARELERLSGADISAARGNGKLAGEAPTADGPS